MYNVCNQKLDIQLLSNGLYRSTSRTFYCSNKNCMTTIEECKHCPLYTKQ